MLHLCPAGEGFKFYTNKVLLLTAGNWHRAGHVSPAACVVQICVYFCTPWYANNCSVVPLPVHTYTAEGLFGNICCKIGFFSCWLVEECWSKCLFIVNYLHTIRQGALLGRHLRDYLTSFMRCNQNFYCLVCRAAVECLDVCRASVEVGLRDKLFSMYVKQASPSNVTKLNFTKFTCQTISLHFYYYHIQNSF